MSAPSQRESGEQQLEHVIGDIPMGGIRAILASHASGANTDSRAKRKVDVFAALHNRLDVLLHLLTDGGPSLESTETAVGPHEATILG